MNWFLIALINPLFHAFNNHLDKYILSRYMKGGSVGAIILFMSLFSVIALPVILLIHPSVFESINWLRAIALMANGCLLVLAILCYFYALNEDETSIVAPFFQMVPVLSFVLGFLILGEILQTRQLLAGVLIVIGGLLLSFEFSEGKTKLRKKVALLMLGSSFFYAINAVIFKSIAVNQGFMDSLFWDMTGKVIFGIFLFLAIKSYREQFVELIKVNKFSIIAINMLNEVIALIAEAALVLAVLYAPVALVQSVVGLQSIFVLIIGVFLSVFIPKFGRESLKPLDLGQKIISIIIITIGVLLISVV